MPRPIAIVVALLLLAASQPVVAPPPDAAATAHRAAPPELPTGRQPGADVTTTAAAGGIDPTDRYILTPRAAAGDSLAVATGLGGAQRFAVSHVYRRARRGFAAQVPPGVVEALRRNSHVLAVVPDRVVAVAATVPVNVDRVDAKRNAGAAIDDVPNAVDIDVAVLDSGIASTHRDLNVVAAATCTTATGVKDQHVLGTHVAGIVGARGDGDGAVGVAPAARLWNVRVIDASSSGLNSWIICGLDVAFRNPAGLTQIGGLAEVELLGPPSAAANPPAASPRGTTDPAPSTPLLDAPTTRAPTPDPLATGVPPSTNDVAVQPTETAAAPAANAAPSDPASATADQTATAD